MTWQNTAQPGPRPGEASQYGAPRPEPATGPLGVIGPFYVARLIFTPSRSDLLVDPLLRKVQLLRAWTGILMTVWLAHTYRTADSTTEFLGERLNQLGLGVLLLAITFPLVIGAFITAARPPRRALYARRTLKPLGALLAFAACWAFFSEFMRPMADAIVSAAPIIGHLAMVVVVLWFVLFTVRSMLLAVSHVLRVADVHELLAPLLSTVLVWELAVADLFLGDFGDAPLAVRLLFILGAPLSVTALSLWEARRLQTRHGITLRGALLR
ncbi:hypothetical protein GCM10010420_43020 [Streptomyces glaucosporus]|uniref:Integral membrane protein n=1 Tax=Streptomyces glaucosporus TaxID=284044 RepID=A0ABN3INI5_9ACTN